MKKVKIFARFAANFGLPFVTFVDSCGLEETRAAADSALLQEIGEYLIALDEIGSAKIAVVTGSAVGLSYSLFAAKSAGFDYTFAFATAKIALFEDRAGAAIELGKQDAYEAYAEENADPFNAARGGYLDDIIEPQFLKQYLIAALETLK